MVVYTGHELDWEGGIMTKSKKEKFINNLWKFTAVFLAALFGQLALGVTWKQASLFALAILYGAFADYFKKS